MISLNASLAVLIGCAFIFAASGAEAAPRPAPRPKPTKQAKIAALAGPIKRIPGKHEPKERCPGIELGAQSSSQPFSAGEELAYELSVSGVYIGRFETKVGKPRIVDGKPALSLFGRARTNSFLSTFSKFAGRYMTLVDSGSMQVVGLRVEATYGDDLRWEKARFSEGSKRIEANFLYQGREGTRSYDAPWKMTDVLAMLYYARTREMPLGREVCQDVFGARWLWRMHAKIEDVVEIDTPAGKKKATRVKTTFQRAPHPDLNAQQLKQKYDMDVYFAKDATQAPLAFTIRTDKFTAEGKLVRWSLEEKNDNDWEL